MKAKILASTAVVMLMAAPAYARNSQVQAPQEKAAADEASGGIQDIIVTAQKRNESVQKVPIAITALSSATLNNAGIATSNDLQRLAPALTMSTIGSGWVSFTYIRGGGTNQADAGSDPSVAYFVDEVYIGGSTGRQLDLFDLDHVEVLMGPQGTLFGRNAASGAISIVTKRPSAEFGVNVNAMIGSYDEKLLKISATGPLNSDKSLLFRASGFYRNRDGYTENLTGGARPGNIDAHGMRGQLEWRAGDVNVLISGDVVRSRNRQTNLYLATANQSGFIDATLPVPAGQSTYAHCYNLIGFENQDLSDLSARIEWDTSIGKITSISAYRHNKFDRVQDQDSTFYDAFILSTTEVSKAFSQELRLTGDVDKLRYTAGLYYYNGDITSSGRFDAGPAYSAAALRNKFAAEINLLKTNSYAVFGQLTYALSDKFSITAGGRYTIDNKESLRTSTTFAGTTFTVNPKPGFSGFTPAITLEYKPTNNIMAYFSYRHGFKSGGFQQLFVQSPVVADTPYLPEKVRSYEFSLKTTFFDRRLLANISLFRSDIIDQQVARITSPAVISIDNAGETRSQGVDFELVAKPVSALTLTANMSYQNARFRKYQSGTISYAGNNQLRSPDFVGYVSAEYAIPLHGLGELTLRGDYSYRSKTFYDLANTQSDGRYAPGYGLSNLRASFTPEGLPDAQIAVFVNNVGKTKYYQNIVVSGLSGLATPGTPRTFGVELGYRF